MDTFLQGLKVEGIPMRFNEKDKIKFANSDKVGAPLLLCPSP